MTRGKQRSPQQQTDERALAILQEKTPKSLLFREQAKDFGIDCELECFISNPAKEGFQLSTGLLFKGQVKGTTRAADLELADGTTISKSFELDDIYYWSEQLVVPVILFLVDVEAESVYWTEFYDNAELREDYRRVKESDQGTMSVHFSKADTFPDTHASLLKAVERAYERIALKTIPCFDAVEQHIRELKDPERELCRVQAHLARSRFEILLRAVKAGDTQSVENEAENIVGSRECDATTKVYAIINMQALKGASFTGKSLRGKFSKSLALLDQSCPPLEADPLGRMFASAMRSAVIIHELGHEILELTKAGLITRAQKGNYLAATLFASSESKVIEYWRELDSTTRRMEEVFASDTLEPVDVAHAAALVTPLLCEAVRPLILAATVRDDGKDLPRVYEYVLSWLQLGIAYADASHNQVLGESQVQATAMYIAVPNCVEPVRSRISDALNNPEHAWLRTFDVIVSNLQAATEQAQASGMRDIDELREMAIHAMTTYGIDVDSVLAGEDSAESEGIGTMVRKALGELDLGEHLTDCIHRCIFVHPSSGTSPLMDSFGLGFAASRKVVGCLKKAVLGNSVGFHVGSGVEGFRTDYCDECDEQEPHPPEWTFSYEYLISKEDAIRTTFPPSFQTRTGSTEDPIAE